MIVTPEGGEAIELGTVETSPTIGIIDYSRRVTDDFGVTTVVARGFARRMSVRLAVPFDDVDELQRQLAALRATPAQWTADGRFAWLDFEGFYKDFQLDLAVPPVSFCTLTVEGLAETEAGDDDGGDPAPTGSTSSLQLLRPIELTIGALTSSVAQADHPEWSAGATYAAGAQVIKAATHRIYESTQSGNVGHDPAADAARWTDVGPTNRWAMFDQALGTATSAASQIVVTLDVDDANAVALLDVLGATVRVQATGYDHTHAVTDGAVTFLDLPPSTGAITVTIAGTGTVSVGTLLVGEIVQLGVTEASPSAGINDYSRKEVDDFGDATIVERAWAKRMSARALIRTDALDQVANRIAAVRARPCLWIGDDALDSLTVYGFFKEFSIEVGQNVSTLSLSIEGLSQAAPRGSLPAPNWTDVVDSDPVNHPKPDDGADVTSEHTANDTANVAGTPSAAVLAAIANAHALLDGLAVDTKAATDAAASALAQAADLVEDADEVAAAIIQRAHDNLKNADVQTRRELTFTRFQDVAFIRFNTMAGDITAAEAGAVATSLVNTDSALAAYDVSVQAQFVITGKSISSAAASTLTTAQTYADKSVATLSASVTAQFKSATADLATASAATLSSAETYADGAVSALKSSVDTELATLSGNIADAAASTLSTAQSYADSAVATLSTSTAASFKSTTAAISKAQTDAEANSAAYTDSAVASVVSGVGTTFATTKAVAAADAVILASAGSYTDSAISTSETKVAATYATISAVSKADATTLSTAQSYADSAVSASETKTAASYATSKAVAAADATTLASAQTYADKAVSTLSTSTDASFKSVAGDISKAQTAAIASSATYTDGAVSTLTATISSTYATTKAMSAADASTLSTAQTYADSAVTASETKTAATYITSAAAAKADASTLTSSQTYADKSSADIWSKVGSTYVTSSAMSAGDASTLSAAQSYATGADAAIWTKAVATFETPSGVTKATASTLTAAEAYADGAVAVVEAKASTAGANAGLALTAIDDIHTGLTGGIIFQANANKVAASMALIASDGSVSKLSSAVISADDIYFAPADGSSLFLPLHYNTKLGRLETNQLVVVSASIDDLAVKTLHLDGQAVTTEKIDPDALAEATRITLGSNSNWSSSAGGTTTNFSGSGIPKSEAGSVFVVTGNLQARAIQNYAIDLNLYVTPPGGSRSVVNPTKRQWGQLVNVSGLNSARGLIVPIWVVPGYSTLGNYTFSMDTTTRNAWTAGDAYWEAGSELEVKEMKLQT